MIDHHEHVEHSPYAEEDIRKDNQKHLENTKLNNEKSSSPFTTEKLVNYYRQKRLAKTILNNSTEKPIA